MARVRSTVGAVLFDLPKFLWGLRPHRREPASAPWIFLHNRSERLLRGPQSRGAACDWRWTSHLHAPAVLPFLGRALMRRMLEAWPIELGSRSPELRDACRVSFIIGHSGLERLPLLLLTLESLAAQRDVSFECVVVEQSATAEIGPSLPAWVRHVHLPTPTGTPYNRSWAFNVGARIARGEILVFHDGDMLAPRAYGAELVKIHDEGYEVVKLARFLFYVSKEETDLVLASRGLGRASPDRVVQTPEGGGTVALGRDVFFQIGGYDEAFVGWGGEDNEFWERAQLLRMWPFGYLPFVHLWHAPQPEKQERQRETLELFRERSRLSPRDRSSELAERAFGRLGREAPPISPDEEGHGG